MSPESKTYSIKVVRLVPVEKLDFDDREYRPEGLYTIDARNEEVALDEFHLNIPISCLEHFSITVAEEK